MILRLREIPDLRDYRKEEVASLDALYVTTSVKFFENLKYRQVCRSNRRHAGGRAV